MPRKHWLDPEGWQGISAQSERLLIYLIRTGDKNATSKKLGITISAFSQATRVIRRTLNTHSTLHAMLLYERYRSANGYPIPLDIKPFHQDAPDAIA